jgi:hypothetical protein
LCFSLNLHFFLSCWFRFEFDLFDKRLINIMLDSFMQSEEDLALKQQLELYVERVQDTDPGVQKLALESMRYLLSYGLVVYQLLILSNICFFDTLIIVLKFRELYSIVCCVCI